MSCSPTVSGGTPAADARNVARFTTLDAVPVDVELAAPAPGGAVPLQDVRLTATWVGALEDPNLESLAWAGTALNDTLGGAGPVAAVNFSAPSSYGSDAVRATLAVLATATATVARCIGIAGVAVEWTVAWGSP